jgi:hypothetical protein
MQYSKIHLDFAKTFPQKYGKNSVFYQHYLLRGFSMRLRATLNALPPVCPSYIPLPSASFREHLHKSAKYDIFRPR